ncbi:MAG: hypothetical protein HDR71_15975 [Lachnospiraceae bacterium]|nr:hypothetical protein [Lachnospiraceae bacterium]
MVIAIIAILSLDIVLFLLLRSNRNKLKRKTEYGKTIPAKVVSWNDIPGRPTIYVVQVEYEIAKEKKYKKLKTNGRFAKKYKYEKNIQIVVIPDSDEAFFEEEDWKLYNAILLFLLLFSASFYIDFLLVGLIKIITG